MTFPDPPRSQPYGPNTAVIRRFLQRFAALDASALAAVVAAYDALQASPSFGRADRAVAAAVERSGRTAERDSVVGPLLRLLPAAPGDAPDVLSPVAEPALAAVLALLLRDELSADAVATLYGPFEPLIPVGSLESAGA
jgi:hypothetical protein